MFFPLKGSKVRFMDTMSLHMAISGLTGFQRTLWMANKLGKRRGLQEVKEHIKKAGQKTEGPTVCVLFFIHHISATACIILLVRLVTFIISRTQCDMMFLCLDWLLGLG